jgi:hypothetical protein
MIARPFFPASAVALASFYEMGQRRMMPFCIRPAISHEME